MKQTKPKELNTMNKFKVNEIVKIKKYPNPNDINHYGRIQSIEGKKYWVVNLGQPFSGTVSAFFAENELESI
jgi:hypothetical protein